MPAIQDKNGAIDKRKRSVLFGCEQILRRVAAEFDVGIDKDRVRAAFLSFRPFDAAVSF